MDCVMDCVYILLVIKDGNNLQSNVCVIIDSHNLIYDKLCFIFKVFSFNFFLYI